MTMDAIEGSGAPAEAPVTTDAPVEAPAETTPVEDNWASRTPDDMREEILRLRKESAGRRDKLKTYGVFDEMTPENAREILDFARAATTTGWNEEAIRQKIVTWGQGFGMTLAEAKAAAAEAMSDATDDGDKPLTVKGLQEAMAKMRADQEAAEKAAAGEREKQAFIDSIRAKVSELGYSEAADPVRHGLLNVTAQRLMRESHGQLDALTALDQAHEALDGWVAQKVDEYMAKKRQDAARVVTPTSTAGTAVPTNEPTDFDEAGRRARARIAARA